MSNTASAIVGESGGTDRTVKNNASSDKGGLEGSKKKHSDADNATHANTSDGQAKPPSKPNVGDAKAPGKGVQSESTVNKLLGSSVQEATTEADLVNMICGACEGDMARLRKGLGKMSKQSLRKLYKNCTGEDVEDAEDAEEDNESDKN